jgi:hypothetical protein
MKSIKMKKKQGGMEENEKVKKRESQKNFVSTFLLREFMLFYTVISSRYGNYQAH